MATRTTTSAGSRATESPFGRVLLVTGPEQLLAERAVEDATAAGRAEVADLEISTVDAADLDAGRLAEISGGSLFADRRMAVITNLAQLPAELFDQVLALAADADPDMAYVFVHGGGQKGKGLLDKLKKAPSVQVTDCPSLKAWEIPAFVKNELRRVGARADEEAGQALVDAIGIDLRAVASAVRQLASDADGGVVTTELVRTYFGGRNEVSGFAVADAVLAGRTGPAMEQLRWALSTGAAPVLITSALASGLRGLGKLITAQGGQRDADLARDVGVPPWKLKSMRSQVRGWDQRGIAHALRVVARADAEVKGAADDAAFSLERAVIEIVSARRS
ncbi:DNA polymerase III subunit delta [Propionibacteriaceae bacterium Y1700]|uniref:DNA polymerase III subunit delta n=1 Tax=Microlunatus sp. Y1700 TaxID=3418487 RepID=UPI003DA74F72